MGSHSGLIHCILVVDNTKRGYTVVLVCDCFVLVWVSFRFLDENPIRRHILWELPQGTYLAQPMVFNSHVSVNEVMCRAPRHLFTTSLMTALDEKLSKDVYAPPPNLPTILEELSIKEAPCSPPPRTLTFLENVDHVIQTTNPSHQTNTSTS